MERPPSSGRSANGLRPEPVGDRPGFGVGAEVESRDAHDALRSGRALGVVELERDAPSPQPGVVRDVSPRSHGDPGSPRDAPEGPFAGA